MNTKSSELSSSCRVCLKKDEAPLKSLLNTYLDSEWYPDIFLKCTTIKIIEKPEQPTWICEECDVELIRVYQFQRKCIESDAVLSAFFVKTEDVKTEENEILECLIKEEDEEEETNSDNELKEEQSSDSDFKEDSESENEEDLKLKKSKKRKKNVKPLEICKVCNEPLPNTKKAYNIHISTHDPGNPTPFECNLCDKKYKTSYQLHAHVKAHEYHINCKFCDEKFRTNLSRTIHERKTHTFIKPYKCDLCVDISYFSKTELNDHNGRHHLKREISCDLCEKKFALNKDLRQHKASHKSERDFQCTICGKDFTSIANVRAHEKQVHCTEERFFCDKCSISFSKKPALWKHNRTVHHSEESPCDVCGKLFDSLDHLRRHKLYHDEVMFQCPVCPTKKFTRMYLLRRHVKASHPTVELPPTIRKIGKKSKLWKEDMNVKTNK